MIRLGKHANAQAIRSAVAEPRGQECNIVQLPRQLLPDEAARLRQAASNCEEFVDCIHMALACLFCFAVLLAASALLSGTSAQGEIARYLHAAFRFLTAASGFAGVTAFGLALVHLILLRQV